MIKRVIFLISLMSLFTLAFAQDVTFGFLQGVVKSDTGVLCVNERVTVSSGKNKFNFTTDAKGFFSTMMPSGDATIEVLGVAKTVKIVEGETTTCELVVVRPGVTLTINNIPANNNDYYVNGAYMLDGREIGLNNPQRVADGKFFFQLPAEATSLAISASFSRNTRVILPTNSIHKIWSFQTKDAVRNLSIDYPKSVQLPIKVTDDTAKAIADGTKITGRINWNYPKNQNFDDWTKVDLADANRRQPTNENYDWIRINATVANGTIVLPEVMPGASYTLQMSIDGGTRGMPVPVIVDENGKTDVTSYSFTPRRVSMTAFDSSGKPAANAIVNASYINDGRMKIISAKSDENGIVNWIDMPPVRATIWGDNIPVGILPANATKSVTPLEPPVRTNTSIYLKSTVDKISGLCVYKSDTRSDYQTQQINMSTDSSRYNNNIGGYLNSPITLYLITNEDIPRCKVITFYIPINDSPDTSYGSTGLLEINDFDIAPSADVKIFNSDGVTPAQFNQLSVASDLYPKEISQTSINQLVKVTRTKKGISLRAAVPGKYKLMIDMLSDPNNPAAEITLPSKDAVTVVLKTESANLPGGAVVNWVDYSNPLEIHSMTLPADAEKPEVPVYYDKNKILGWWSKTAPNNLRICTNGEVKNLVLKTFTVKQVDENGKEIANLNNGSNYYSSLLALFPQTMDYNRGQQNQTMFNIISNSENVAVALTNKARLNLWLTKYLINSPYGNGQKIASMLEINKDTPAELVIKRPVTTFMNTTPVNSRYINIEYNIAGKMNYNSNSDMMVYPDGDISKKKILRRNDSFIIDYPDTTTKITIIFPTVGIAKDVPYKFVDNYLRLKTTDFKPLTTIKGKFYDAKGAVMKNAQVSIIFAGSPDSGCGLSMSKTTDADGNYSFENIPAGTYQINDSSNMYYGNRGTAKPGMWLVKVPEDKAEILFDLKLIETPVFIRPYNINENSYNGITVGAYAWLLQDGTDKAIQLPFSRSITCIHDFKPKNGILYIYSASSNSGRSGFYSRVNWDTKIDINNYNATMPETKLPLTSLIAPLIENVAYPTTATVNGTGPWEEVKYTQIIQWQFYAGLNCAIAQCGSLPPGDWIVKMTTASGKVIEKKITVGKDDQSVKIDVQ
ncbi:MAG: carboxypeptidase-like regulatory domain-containing protein [bacterium]